MSTTLDFFNATKAQPLSVKPGRLTLEQAVGLFDALNGVKTVCHHVLSEASWMAARIDAIPTGKCSIVRAVRILKLWERWTHGPNIPAPTQCQSFLFAFAHI